MFDSERPASMTNSEGQPEKKKVKSPDQYETEKPKPSYYWATKNQFYSTSHVLK